MPRLVLLLPFLLVALAPAAASAATLSDFRVRDIGAFVRYEVDVCTARPAQLRFTGYLRAPDGGASYPTAWRVQHRSGCQHWALDAPDLLPAGRWRAWLQMEVGAREYRTPTRTVRLTRR
jgi:hypothetical protein